MFPQICGNEIHPKKIRPESVPANLRERNSLTEKKSDPNPFPQTCGNEIQPQKIKNLLQIFLPRKRPGTPPLGPARRDTTCFFDPVSLEPPCGSVLPKPTPRYVHFYSRSFHFLPLLHSFLPSLPRPATRPHPSSFYALPDYCFYSIILISCLERSVGL